MCLSDNNGGGKNKTPNVRHKEIHKIQELPKILKQQQQQQL